MGSTNNLVSVKRKERKKCILLDFLSVMWSGSKKCYIGHQNDTVDSSLTNKLKNGSLENIFSLAVHPVDPRLIH